MSLSAGQEAQIASFLKRQQAYVTEGIGRPIQALRTHLDPLIRRKEIAQAAPPNMILGTTIESGAHSISGAVWTPADLSLNIYFNWQLGVTGTAPVTAWANQGSNGGSFADATHGPDVSGDALAFGSGDYLLASAKTVTDFLHQGAASFWALVILGSGTGSEVLLDTNNLSISAAGCAVYFNKTNQQIVFRAGDGRNATSAAGSIPGAGTYLIELDLDPASGIACWVNGTPSAVTGTTTGTPSASTASQTPAIGARASGFTTPLLGSVRALGGLDRILSAGEHTQLRAYYGY